MKTPVALRTASALAALLAAPALAPALAPGLAGTAAAQEGVAAPDTACADLAAYAEAHEQQLSVRSMENVGLILDHGEAATCTTALEQAQAEIAYTERDGAAPTPAGVPDEAPPPAAPRPAASASDEDPMPRVEADESAAGTRERVLEEPDPVTSDEVGASTADGLVPQTGTTGAPRVEGPRAGVGGGAPAAPPGTDPAVAQPVDGLTAEGYVQQAASGDLFEIRSSELALERAEDAALRDFAEAMVADHSALSEALHAAVMEAGLEDILPVEADLRHTQLLSALEAAEDDFDRQYVGMQLSAHEEALALHAAYAEGGDVEALRAVAAEAAAQVDGHLERIRMIAEAYGEAAGEGAGQGAGQGDGQGDGQAGGVTAPADADAQPEPADHERPGTVGDEVEGWPVP